jgi:hypothetical protein
MAARDESRRGHGRRADDRERGPLTSEQRRSKGGVPAAGDRAQCQHRCATPADPGTLSARSRAGPLPRRTANPGAEPSPSRRRREPWAHPAEGPW